MNLSKQLINGFIQTELEHFIKQFDESPVHEIQDDRSLAIAWLCYYFKDSVSSKNASSIIHFVDKVYHMDNYRTHGWYRVPALQAAAFILSSDIHYANMLIQNIACAQSWARDFIIESAGIICPLISFDNPILKKVTENNIKYSHGYFQESTILYLFSKGKSEEKINWLDYQIHTAEKDHHRIYFNDIKINNKPYESGFFVSAYSKAKSYIIFKMLSNPSLAEVQPNLLDGVDINFKDLTALEKKHPLNTYYFDLSFLRNEK